MNNEAWPPQLSPADIKKMAALHGRFVEALDAGHGLPSDGRLGRPVSESLTPDAVAYVLGTVGTLPGANEPVTGEGV